MSLLPDPTSQVNPIFNLPEEQEFYQPPTTPGTAWQEAPSPGTSWQEAYRPPGTMASLADYWAQKQ